MLSFLRSCQNCAIAVLFAVSSGAQTPSWTLPASGYVFDSVAHSVRPVAGFLGSSYAGPAALTGVAWASVAPGGHAALLIQQDRLWWIQDLSNPNASPNGLDGIDAASVDCRWSVDASKVAILSPGTLTWLSASQVTSRVDVSAIQTGAWTLLAADAQANSILLAVKSADVWNLWLVSPNADPVNLGAAQHPVAAVFAQRTPFIYVAEADVPRVSRISTTGGSPAQGILGTDNGIQSVSGLALSQDDQKLFVADPQARAIHAYDFASSESFSDLLLCENPGALLPSGSGQFLVNTRERPDAPLLLLDTSSAPPRVWFVPLGGGQ